MKRFQLLLKALQISLKKLMQILQISLEIKAQQHPIPTATQELVVGIFYLKVTY